MENYKITKEQILAIEKVGGADVSLYLKETFPEVFKTEFKVGTVYKIDKNIFYCTEINERGVLYGYGLFDAKWGERFNNGSHICACNELAAKDRLVEASTQEWESALINEAKKRGFKLGVKVVGLYNDGSPHQITDFIINKDDFTYKTLDNALVCNKLGFRIFAKGKWAEILSQEKTVVPIAKALKIIAKKMKVSPENIEIQY